MKQSFLFRVGFAVSLFVTGVFNVQAAEVEWSTDGFDQPESVYFDSTHQKVFVSNINGQPNEKNNKGYIALLSPDGKIQNKHWVSGMDAPKGMTVVGNYLFVSDIQKIHKIDIEQAKIVKTYKAPQATFLNDISASMRGDVYISDMLDNTIYKLADDELSLWLKSNQIAHPNGLIVEGETLYVGTWGEGINDDFTTQKAGSLITVDLKSQKIMPLSGGAQLGNLDGVVRLNGQTIVNDWITGQMYRVTPQGQAHQIGAFHKGLADISSDGRLIFMPYMFDGRVDAVLYSSLKAQ